MAAPLRPETPAERAAAAGWPAQLDAYREQRRAERLAGSQPTAAATAAPAKRGERR